MQVDDRAWTNHAGLSGGPHQPGAELAGFARRVLALAEDPGQPLLERVKFAGIMGMIYDEFAMKRTGGLLRQIRKGWAKRGPDGLTPAEVLKACRAELRTQQQLVATLVDEQLRPALRDLGIPILDAGDLCSSQRDFLTRDCMDSVEPILVPLAADAAHPFPFISNLGLNLAVLVSEPRRSTLLRPDQGACQPAALGAAARRGRLGAPRAGARSKPGRVVPAGIGVGLLFLPGHQGREGRSMDRPG